MWTYYGASDRMRAFAPSIGFATTFLSFGDSTDTIEESQTLQFGFGPVFGLFNRALVVTLGYNLQGEATRTAASGTKASRWYSGVGLSVTQVVSNVKRLIDGEG